MRRTMSLLAMMLALAMIAVGCGETKDTGFAPPPEPSAADDEHGGEGDGGGSEDEFEAEPQSGPATELTIKALDIRFNREEMEFVADEPIALTFDNLDVGIQHNVAVYIDETAAEEVFVGEIFSGDDERTYDVPATPAGTYFYRCDVHPSMKGELTFS